MEALPIPWPIQLSVLRLTPTEKYAVSIETSINHIEALEEGDYITAESVAEITKNKLGFHVVEIKRRNEIVALFKGLVYRTSKDWEK